MKKLVVVSLFCFGLLIALPAQGEKDAKVSRKEDVELVYQQVIEKLRVSRQNGEWFAFGSGSYDGGIVLMPVGGNLRINMVVRKLSHLEIRTIPCCVDSEPWGVAVFASDWPDSGALNTIYILGDMKKRLSQDEIAMLIDAAASALTYYLDQHFVRNE